MAHYNINKMYARHTEFILKYYHLPLKVVSYSSGATHQTVSVEYLDKMPYPIENRRLLSKISCYVPQPRKYYASQNITIYNIPNELNAILNPSYVKERLYKWELR